MSRVPRRCTYYCHIGPVVICSPLVSNIIYVWIIYVVSVLFCYAFMHVYLLWPCGHLLTKVKVA